MRLIDFENGLRNGRVERSVYAELLKQVFPEGSQQGKVMKRKRSLYGLRGAAREWDKLLFKTATDIGLE